MCIRDSPILAPTPWIDKAVPRLLGYVIERAPIPAGCHKAVPNPITAEAKIAIEYEKLPN